MTARERVELMREIKAEAKRRRRADRLRSVRNAAFLIIGFALFIILAVINAEEADACGKAEIFGTWEQAVPAFTEGEAMEMMRVARAEAGNQGAEGQALVMLVILNRVEDGRFGSSIHEVITAPSQFSTVSSGAWLQEPNADSFEALELIRNGWDESQGALYFRATWSGHFSWAHYLFTYGGHNFYN